MGHAKGEHEASIEANLHSSVSLRCNRIPLGWSSFCFC